MTLYTVHSDGQPDKSTESAALALDWAQNAGPAAFVTEPSPRTCRPRIVWTPSLPRCSYSLATRL
jgi:hypothetical protein